MLQLMLFRHAQADHPDNVRDHERPLSTRGHEQARIMGKYIRAQDLIPELAIVSTSRRTQDTWADTIDAGKMTTAKVDERRIYESSVTNLLDVVKGQDAKYSRIMLLGHNPGLEHLAIWLIGSGAPSALARLQQGFVVGSLAVISIPAIAWSALQAQSGQLEHFETPDTVK